MDGYRFGQLIALIAIVIGLVDLARRPMPRMQKLVWAAIILLLPLIGTIAYFLLRSSTTRSR